MTLGWQSSPVETLRKVPTKALVISRALCTSARRRISIEGEIYR